MAKEAGADAVIAYTDVDFETEIKPDRVGAGVDVVYDSVGEPTFEKGLACLKPRGVMVFFGQSSGKLPDPDTQVLAPKSLYLTRPMLGDYISERAELEWRARDLFSWIADGTPKLTIGGEFSLADAAKAHQRLQERERIGKLILVP